MSKGVITFALAALLAVPLIAGPGEQAPPPELILKEVLQLTDPQIGAIQQLAQARQQAIEPLAKQIAATQQALYEALEAAGADPATVGKLAMTIRELQRQVGQHEQDYAQGFLALLTEPQRSQVQQIRGVESALRAAAALHQLGL
jgi:Spy/CpxP family protein refolding chaperone